MIEQKYGPNRQFGRTFGERRLLDKNERFFEQPIIEQVKQLAWSEGCPVRNKVINRNGPEAARNRYGEVIFTSQIILAEAEEHNPKLYSQLKQGIKRNDSEPVGEHEPTSVPSSHLKKISASNTPWGYLLPRILIEQFGKREERNQGRMIKGLQILETSIKKADSPLELIAIFSENIVKTNPAIIDLVLKQAFSQAYLNEEKTVEMYEALLIQIKKHSPILYKRYRELNSEGKLEEKGIALLLSWDLTELEREVETMTPGQIYDSNFSIRTANARKYNPDWSKEHVNEDSIRVFGTREEFIKEWLGDEEICLPSYSKDKYERGRKTIIEIFGEHNPLLTTNELEQSALQRMGSFDEWVERGKRSNHEEIVKHYKFRKKLLKRVLKFGEITEQDYQERISKLKQWYSSSQKDL